MKVFIGKQPILGLGEKVVYYELLYRSSDKKRNFSEMNHDQATADVLVNAFLTIGIENLTNNRPCFVNFTENLLMHDFLETFDPNLLVIEILETVPISQEVIDRVRELKNKNYRFALDDFFIQSHANTDLYYELFSLVDFIKIDFMNTHVDERLLIENIVQYEHKHIRLLAEKIETLREYEEAKEAGYSFFQGYYFEQPKVVIHTDIPTNTIFYYKILSILNEEEPNINEMVDIIKKDVSLTFKLLQLANTINPNMNTTISSVRHALTLIGFKELRKWIYLMSVRDLEDNHTNEIDQELIEAALIRAKQCELMAKTKGYSNASEFYLTGMFSNIQAILKRPLDKIIESLPFSKEVIDTLIGEQTEMTNILHCSIALQKLEWDYLDTFVKQLEFSSADLADFYYEAVQFAKETQKMKAI